MANLHDYGYKEHISVFGDPDAQDPDPEIRKRFFGKYRGAVRNNIDPLGQGRLMVSVPDVLGVIPVWALPCLPMAGPNMGMYVVPPPVGTAVWVEFEQGDPESAIWVGCFWDGPAALPGTYGILAATMGAGKPAVAIETLTSGVALCDTPLGTGNVTIYYGPTTSITLGASGVNIMAPSVSITTPSFKVNETHLTVV